MKPSEYLRAWCDDRKAELIAGISRPWEVQGLAIISENRRHVATVPPGHVATAQLIVSATHHLGSFVAFVELAVATANGDESILRPFAELLGWRPSRATAETCPSCGWRFDTDDTDDGDTCIDECCR